MASAESNDPPGTAVPTRESLRPSPVVDWLAHRMLEASLLRRLVGDDAEPVRVDRFVLERELGAGGMGTIYAAWDGELRRRVALKFLHQASSDPDAEQRLFREAQALAQLSHPNIVPIYDVGRHEGRVWLAMEHISGQTLRAWADAAPRRPAEMLEAWLAAGRGLAAIHAIGLVHRDIKPDNVMIGEDGRVRIVDFGLVRLAETSRSRSSEALATVADWADGLTSPDGFVGTRAYAAPEQIGGGILDARIDQFSFCVALWEALCGKRPLRERTSDGRPVRREGERLPARLLRALSRGLAIDPHQRWDDMDALLAALAPPRRRWPVLGIVGAGAASLGLVAGTMMLGSPPAATQDPCAQATAPLAEAWSPAIRADVVARLGESDAGATITALDDWAARWRGAAQQTCEDVYVDKRLSPASLDRRGPCLSQRIATFTVVVQGLASGALGSETRAVAFAGLEDPSACLADEVLDREVEPVPVEHTDAVAELRRALVRLELERGELSLSQRIAAAEHVLERSRELGWSPLVGEAALVVGRLHTALGDGSDARERLGEALDIAEGTRDVELQRHAWSALHQVERLVEFDVPRARWALSREAAVMPGVEPSPRQRAQLLLDQGQTEELAGDLDAAVRSLRGALVVLDDEGTLADWDRALVLHALGNVLSHTGRDDEAREHLARARDLELGRTGEDARPGQHAPSNLAIQFDEALAMIAGGEARAAVERLRGISAEVVREHGPSSEMAARVHVALAAAHDHLGEVDEVRRHAELADRISLRAVGPAHPMRADVLSAVGVAATHDGRIADAVLAFEWSLRLVRRLKAPASLDVALAEHNLASALVDADRRAEAEDLLSHALPILEQGLGQDDALVADARRLMQRARMNHPEGAER